MDKRVTGLTKTEIILGFPKLAFDANFEITSEATPSYNCIAWAYSPVSSGAKWMWPKSNESSRLDAILFWPNGIENNEDIATFMDAFRSKDYNQCDSWQHETGFQKIALYAEEGTTKCTHAAREIVGDKKNCGKWTSKLGSANDISHSSPYELEGKQYGKVYCIMKRVFF